MFKITPIQNAEMQEEYATLCSTKRVEGAFAYAMFDVESGSPMGFSQFEISEDGGHLLDLRPVEGLDDYEAMFILGRQTMNFVDLCGAHVIYAKPTSADEQLLKAIGLRLTESGHYFRDMSGLFEGEHCSGHK